MNYKIHEVSDAYCRN